MIDEGNPDVVGLVPAAGQAARLGPLPCSKEVYPIGFARDDQNGQLRPKVAGDYLLEKFSKAGVGRAYVIVRNGKWDIPAYFGDGGPTGIHIAYVVIARSLGPADTIDRAYPFVRRQLVAFGFPDILFGPDDVFKQLLERRRETRSDIMLGLYPPSDICHADMVDVDAEGRVHSIALKPQRSDLRYGWICAVWTPAFTDLIHGFLEDTRRAVGAQSSRITEDVVPNDLTVGELIKAGIDKGLRVGGQIYPDASYIDIGTPASLLAAMRTCISHV
jgi:glucose-1-phosphate thymidylyltransferase